MNQESKYRIVLLDKNGYDIGERFAENLKEAKQVMAYMFSDAYAKVTEITHEKTGTYGGPTRSRFATARESASWMTYMIRQERGDEQDAHAAMDENREGPAGGVCHLQALSAWAHGDRLATRNGRCRLEADIRLRHRIVLGDFSKKLAQSLYPRKGP